MIGHDTYAYRRDLPHLQKTGKTYFVTFSSICRRVLLPDARSIVMQCCLHDNELTYWLHCVVIMPDHAHMLFTPYEGWTLAALMERVKSVSSHFINRDEGTRGHRWQHESFDHIVRSGESLARKSEHICDNPVRAGLVTDARDYPWTWNRYWSE
jgi:putative transposase